MKCLQIHDGVVLEKVIGNAATIISFINVLNIQQLTNVAYADWITLHRICLKRIFLFYGILSNSFLELLIVVTFM